MNYEKGPLDQAADIVGGAFIRGEAQNIGDEILSALDDHREILYHLDVVNNSHNQHAVEDEVTSLAYLMGRVTRGDLPEIYDEQVAELYFHHHLGVVSNFYGRYPRKMRTESMRILRQVLSDPSTDPEAREQITETIDLSSTWNFIKAKLAGRLRESSQT